MLKPNMPYPNDVEGSEVPAGLPTVIDVHVHVFPDAIFSAIWNWFDKNAWHIRYQLNSRQVLEYLLSRGEKHIIALQYAHKPGMAGQLNEYMAALCHDFDGRVTGMATVYPGEADADKILQAGFDAGLGGLKLHAHVQCFDINSKSMNALYECCQHNRKPIVMHVGREPKSTAYRCDPYTLCGVDKLVPILKAFPDLKICVPHLGFDETRAYRELIEKHDNLWLDTTMVITDYFPHKEKIDLGAYRADRVMYGSDFPSIPYAWDRELKHLLELNLHPQTLKQICYQNAIDFFGLTEIGGSMKVDREHYCQPKL